MPSLQCCCLRWSLPRSEPTDVYLDQTRERWTAVARKIWDTPETALQEKKSAQALVEALQKEGFKVTWGVGGEPTAFVAIAGSGSPTIAFLAEYDALPGLSQKPGIRGEERGGGEAGPATGAGTTSSGPPPPRQPSPRTGSASPGSFRAPSSSSGRRPRRCSSARRSWCATEPSRRPTWSSPGTQTTRTGSRNRTRLAAAASEVEFFGRSAHAAAAPWAGRSALDALMLFDHAMALMREHIKPTARIHRVIQEGGDVANVIPDHTRAEYWVRDATRPRACRSSSGGCARLPRARPWPPRPAQR